MKNYSVTVFHNPIMMLEIARMTGVKEDSMKLYATERSADEYGISRLTVEVEFLMVNGTKIESTVMILSQCNALSRQAQYNFNLSYAIVPKTGTTLVRMMQGSYQMTCGDEWEAARQAVSGIVNEAQGV